MPSTPCMSRCFAKQIPASTITSAATESSTAICAHVVEVDPESELVDREARADPEQRRADLESGALVEERKPERPGTEHQADAPDEVVEMHPAVADHASRPPGHAGTAAEPRAHADETKRDEEADEHEEESLPVMGDELVVPEVRQERGG